MASSKQTSTTQAQLALKAAPIADADEPTRTHSIGASVAGLNGENREQSLEKMSLAILIECCIREIARFRRKEPNNDQYGLEILRRAIIRHDNDAWVVLQHLFNESVRLWIGYHPYREAALQLEAERNYIDDTFRRFWQALKDQEFNFATLAEALNYLHLCLNASIVDTLRAYSRTQEERIHVDNNHDGLLVEDCYEADELWKIIASILSSEKEKRVAYLLFHCNLKPREIVRYCPAEFRSEEEIYHLKRNILKRILRNGDVIRWKLSGDEK